MVESMTLVLAWTAGVLLGVLFFGGLWWTVRKGLSGQRPAAWFLVSLLMRMGITLAGFYLVGRGDWKRLVACLVGFVMARLLVTWLTTTSGQPCPNSAPENSGQETRHATQS